MSFKQNRILILTFVETQFGVMWVFEFITKGNSYEDICWVSAWSYVSLWVLHKSEFLWRHLLILSLKLSKFMSFKKKRILMKTFAETQFGVTQVYEFQTNANFYEHTCWLSVWSYESFSVSNKRELLWRHLFSLSLKFFTFMTLKPKQILTKTFVESQFQVM